MKRKLFYFNDGLDGVILARSLKHAISILTKCYKHVSKAEIRKGIKTGEEQYSGCWGVDWWKTNTKGKSRIIGWCE